MMTQCRFYFKHNYAYSINLGSIYNLVWGFSYPKCKFFSQFLFFCFELVLLLFHVLPIGSKPGKSIGAWARNKKLSCEIKTDFPCNIALRTLPPHIRKLNVCISWKTSIYIQKHLYFYHYACRRFYVHSCHDEHHRYKWTAQVTPWFSLAFQIRDLHHYITMWLSSRPYTHIKHYSVSVLLTTGTTTCPPTRHSWGEVVIETSL